jgi:hypothetical protein
MHQYKNLDSNQQNGFEQLSDSENITHEKELQRTIALRKVLVLLTPKKMQRTKVAAVVNDPKNYKSVRITAGLQTYVAHHRRNNRWSVVQ